MRLRSALAALAIAGLAACAAPEPAPATSTQTGNGWPLDTLPAGFDPALVRQDLLATAADRFDLEALDEALAEPTHLIVKRFVGMAPPPPPGAGPDWRPPTPAALLVRQAEGWMVASGRGWRPADSYSAAELDSILADRAFWSEPAYTPPCPDYGARLLLLKVPGKAETVRNSTCISRASRVVEAALRA